MGLEDRRKDQDTSPWQVGDLDLLERFDRSLRLAARRGRRALPRPLDEREEESK